MSKTCEHQWILRGGQTGELGLGDFNTYFETGYECEECGDYKTNIEITDKSL